MSFAFEAGVLSVLIGAILSVLIPSGLLSGLDESVIPPRVSFALRALDVWLVAVFGLVALVLLYAVLQALSHHEPLSHESREVCLHLLALLAVYPAFTALGKRTLPILYTVPNADGPSPRLEVAVLLLPLIALVVAAELLPVLIDPANSFSTDLLLVSAMGLVVVGPCVAVPVLAPWRRQRLVRRAREEARTRRLVEQTVVGTVPHSSGEEAIRVFFALDGSPGACWIDHPEASRVIGRLSEAAYLARREGLETARTDRWWVHSWPNRRLSVRNGRGEEAWRREWRCEAGCLFEAGELLTAVSARMPLSD